MESKSFKDYVVEEPSRVHKQTTKTKSTPTKQQNVIVETNDTPTIKVIETSNTPVTPSFIDRVDREQIRADLYESEKIKLEEQIRQSLQEEYDSRLNRAIVELKEELTNSVFGKISESNDLMVTFMKDVMETNRMLMEKVNELQTNLNITFPTPVIQLTVPNKPNTKVIHRDETGAITKITDEYREDE